MSGRDDQGEHEQPHEPHFTQPVGPADPESATDAQLEAYDLDGDGHISLVENERARLGLVDAKLERMAAKGGVAGVVAKIVHQVVDRFDND
ncbi:MAG: hypothetical protein HKN41_13785 [Ilumatobacter sp.]|nr:hypothetical protein [Ilumatobacter sp.]